MAWLAVPKETSAAINTGVTRHFKMAFPILPFRSPSTDMSEVFNNCIDAYRFELETPVGNENAMTWTRVAVRSICTALHDYFSFSKTLVHFHFVCDVADAVA